MLVVPASTRNGWRVAGNAEKDLRDCGRVGGVMGENMTSNACEMLMCEGCYTCTVMCDWPTRCLPAAV